MPNFIDLTERRFGRLLVLQRAPNVNKRTYWLCRCDCGKSAIVFSGSLSRGFTQSCGCLRREAAREIIETNRPPQGSRLTHGMAESPEYSSWCAMKKRCLNPNSIRFERWGGRGIRICPQWVNSFETFYADMGPRPTVTHSIDRIDNDGNYEPGNCRWATRKEQRKNRRNPKLLLGERSGASRRSPGPRTRNRS